MKTLARRYLSLPDDAPADVVKGRLEKLRATIVKNKIDRDFRGAEGRDSKQKRIESRRRELQLEMIDRLEAIDYTDVPRLPDRDTRIGTRHKTAYESIIDNALGKNSVSPDANLRPLNENINFRALEDTMGDKILC